MKLMKFRYLLIASLLISNLSFAISDDAFTDGKSALLTHQQCKDLTARKGAIAVPTSVPKGFQLGKMELLFEKDSDAVDYTLVYVGPSGKTFIIHGSNDGLGDVMINDEGVLKGKNPYLKGEIYINNFEDSQDLASQWIQGISEVQPKGAKTPLSYSLSAPAKSELSKEETLKIMSSLRFLKK